MVADVAAKQNSNNHTQPSSIRFASSPTFDADGWLNSVDTFSTGSQPGEGTTYTLSWRYRMYTSTGEVVRDFSHWTLVDRLEWFGITTSEGLTSQSYRQTTGLVNYRDVVNSMTGSGSVEMTITGTDETVFSSGFTFRITSFEAYDGITFSGTSGTLYYHGLATWSASNEVLTGILTVSGPNSTSLTYSGSVALLGVNIGTLSYDPVTKNISIIDNAGNVILPH